VDELKNYKAKLRWRCHRGMLELDIILMRFLDVCFDDLSNDERLLFEEMLKEPDPDLYAWLMGHKPVNKKEFEALVQLISTKT